ncbi:MAG: helix-turn-helix domain-containing protein [Baekduia sp.]
MPDRMTSKMQQQRRRETLRPHLVRDRILDAMATYGSPISPTQLQRALPDQSLGSVAYHMRVLASAGVIELADETKVRGAVEHHYAIVAEVAEDFVDPVSRLQTLCGELMETDPVSGLPRAIEPDEDTQRRLLDFLLNDVKPRVAEIIGTRQSDRPMR